MLFLFGCKLIQTDLVFCISGVAPDMLQSRPLSFNSGAHSHCAVRMDSWKPGEHGRSVTLIRNCSRMKQSFVLSCHLVSSNDNNLEPHRMAFLYMVT